LIVGGKANVDIGRWQRVFDGYEAENSEQQKN
jgi:hypothetical protein